MFVLVWYRFSYIRDLRDLTIIVNDCMVRFFHKFLVFVRCIDESEFFSKKLVMLRDNPGMSSLKQ